MNAVTSLSTPRARTWPRAVAGTLALWTFLDVAVLAATFPYWPRTAARWGLLLGLGPAMYLSLAGLFEYALLPRLRNLGARHRAVALAAVFLLVAAIVALAAWWTFRVEG